MFRFLLSSLVLMMLAAFADAGGDPKDPKSWTPVKIPGKQQAPEFDDIARWINSQPLAMRELKGNVVVVHFMAFG